MLELAFLQHSQALRTTCSCHNWLALETGKLWPSIWSIFLPIRLLENNTPVNMHTWRQLILNLTLFSCVTKVSFPWPPCVSTSWVFQGNFILQVPFVTCHHALLTALLTSPMTLTQGETSAVSLISPMKSQTWMFYPNKIMLPNILNWYLDKKSCSFFFLKDGWWKVFLICT